MAFWLAVYTLYAQRTNNLFAYALSTVGIIVFTVTYLIEIGIYYAPVTHYQQFYIVFTIVNILTGVIVYLNRSRHLTGFTKKNHTLPQLAKQFAIIVPLLLFSPILMFSTVEPTILNFQPPEQLNLRSGKVVVLFGDGSLVASFILFSFLVYVGFAAGLFAFVQNANRYISNIQRGSLLQPLMRDVLEIIPADLTKFYIISLLAMITVYLRHNFSLTGVGLGGMLVFWWCVYIVWGHYAKSNIAFIWAWTTIILLTTTYAVEFGFHVFEQQLSNDPFPQLSSITNQVDHSELFTKFAMPLDFAQPTKAEPFLQFFLVYVLSFISTSILLQFAARQSHKSDQSKLARVTKLPLRGLFLFVLSAVFPMIFFLISTQNVQELAVASHAASVSEKTYAFFLGDGSLISSIILQSFALTWLTLPFNPFTFRKSDIH
ncbi:hypothetical protein [Pseudovibrio brasiliensis]|uniref:Uncharacterized protein n=1 Tax=Pseudovibrio brasiliensis TaxID=1898042 RepID=A0ABX8AUE3_9HYPH|nr:hypothetical protein [Pseudovibrio brasiliensis]QUS58679.1 hypothetical protein KGB56_25070 [Pseudovibrio brasiliensis]